MPPRSGGAKTRCGPLVDAVRSSLRASLQLDRAELDTLLRNVESRLDLSILRMLGRETEPESGA